MFEDIVLTMAELDLFHLFLPWLLVLAVTYGVLQKQEVFEEDLINASVSLAVAFLAVGGFQMFAPPGLFGHFAAVVGFAVFGFLGLFILLAVVGIDITDFENADERFPAIAAASVAVLGAISVMIYQFNIIDLLIGSIRIDVLTFEEHIMPVLILLFLLAIIVFITREGGE